MSIPYTWIYLIHDPYTGLYKIGKSDNPGRRLSELRNPPGGTIAAAPTEYFVDRAWLAEPHVEADLHKQFHGARVRGEWFELNDDHYRELCHTMRRCRQIDEEWTQQEHHFIECIQQHQDEIARLEAENEVLRIYASRSFELGPAPAYRKLIAEPMGDIAF